MGGRGCPAAHSMLGELVEHVTRCESCERLQALEQPSKARLLSLGPAAGLLVTVW